MSDGGAVPSDCEDSVFDSGEEHHHSEGERPSGTSTPNQSDGGGGARV